jgi:hypothetical protein
MRMGVAGLTGLLLSAITLLPAWEFDTPKDLDLWVPNGHIANISLNDGVIQGQTTNWDPFFLCRQMEFPATPWQYVLVRIKANKPGNWELFWSKDLEGQYGAPVKRRAPGLR